MLSTVEGVPGGVKQPPRPDLSFAHSARGRGGAASLVFPSGGLRVKYPSGGPGPLGRRPACSSRLRRTPMSPEPARPTGTASPWRWPLALCLPVLLALGVGGLIRQEVGRAADPAKPAPAKAPEK